MDVKHESLAQNILEHARGLPEGAPLVANGLLLFGNRRSVGRALSLLASRGELYRIGRGVCVLPLACRFGEGPPSVHKTVMALARQNGERIALNGAYAANMLGLTSQVPAQLIYLTSGRPRILRFGKLDVELRHAPDWQLVLGESKAGMAVRALYWFGTDWKETAVKRLRRSLNQKERKELAGISTPMPSWVDGALREIANG